MLLVAAAVMEELQPFLAVGDFAEPEPGIFRARDQELLVTALGIGPFDCAVNLARLLPRYALRAAVFTGSCGVYPGAAADYPLGSLVAPCRVRLGDLGEARGQAYFPNPQSFALELDREFAACLADGVDGHCLTLSAITADAGNAERLQKFYRADFEQMEAYAFARLCQCQGLVSGLLLAVVNQVGPEGHRQWLANAAAGAETCARRLWERIDSL